MSCKDTRSAYHNCEKMIFDGVGIFDVPRINPIDIDLNDLETVGFNYAIGEKHPESKILHFYVDDYQFKRVWDSPDTYLNMLKKFKAVLSPDFSLYSDFPKAVQIFNHYRKQWLSAYWQMHSIKVIPTICWSDEDSFEWCFDGVPHNSLISISTVGGFKNAETKEAWLKGYNKCIEVLEPSCILLFGNKWKELEIETNMSIPMVVVENSMLSKFQALKTKKISNMRGDSE